MHSDSLFNQLGKRKEDLSSAHIIPRRMPVDVWRSHFDSLTIGMHWATAFLVLALFATAWLHALAEERHSDITPLLLQIHRSLGVTVWALTALRLAWRLSYASLPPFPAQM